MEAISASPESGTFPNTRLLVEQPKIQQAHELPPEPEASIACRWCQPRRDTREKHEEHEMHNPTPAAQNKYWSGLLAPYTKPVNRKALFQLVTTGLLFALNWYLMLLSLSGPYWITLLAALPAAGLSTRLFIFQHDCGHGAFFRSQATNNRIGGLLGVLTLMPYRYWRRTHAFHHGGQGDLDRRGLGDIITLTVDEYLAPVALARSSYRLYRNPSRPAAGRADAPVRPQAPPAAGHARAPGSGSGPA